MFAAYTLHYGNDSDLNNASQVITVVLQSIYFRKPRNFVLRGGRRLYPIVTLLPSEKSLILCWEFFTHAPPENDHQLFLIVG